MLKNILKLEGTQKLTKNEQKSIKGGIDICNNGAPCPEGFNFCCTWGCSKVQCLEL